MKTNTKRMIVITGGTKGIGAAIAQAFYDQGDYVICGARSDNGFVKKLGIRAHFIKMDVRKEEDHQRIIKDAIKRRKDVDVYINSAGFSKWSPIEKISEEFWNKMIDTNLKGSMWGCKAAAKHMVEGGSIININSLAGKRGSFNNAAYCASKFGITGLTQALAKELGPRGIRVNAVCPVYVQTKGLITALKEKSSPAKGRDVQKYLKEFASTQSSLNRLPSGDEIAQTCLFLASGQATAITGQSINVDCGVMPQ